MDKPDPPLVDPESPTVVTQDEPGSVLVELMEQCLAKLEAGEPVDRLALVSAHPDLESQIDACLASLQFIHRAVQPTEGIPARLADFRIVREIGRGGMGVVYEAEQISLKRQVALKVLRFGAVADPEAMKRFQREAETIASLHHTNIVPVFAVGMEKSIHYYAMQLIEGRSLREVAQDSAADPISSKTIAQWGLQAAEALAHAHERGVVHRDIKPGNLILGLDGRIWLTDFGLAKRLDDVTLSLCGALLGTPRYMSPEQASALRHPVDHRTDIYSLGATLYELVTKRPLFDSDSPHIVISQILTTEPKPPREFAPNVPRDLETIILKCLCKDSGKRYQHARELADDLRAFEEGRAIKARRATVVERAGRWLKQHGRSLAITVAAVAVTAALVIVGTEWWEMSIAASNGRLKLTTKEGPLSGEILTATGEQVVPSFTVPNEQPALVPEGEYQLRAIGRGSLSKTGWLTLNRGPAQEIAVDIDRPELYPSVALNSMTGYEFIDFGAGPDLVVMPDSPNIREPDSKQHRAKPNALTRLAGATGKEIWSLDISQKSEALKELLPTDELRSQWWMSTGFGWKSTSEPPLRVLRPLTDLDADGVPDLVWRLHQGYNLFAVSGKTGRPLWWQASRFTDAAGNSIEKITSQTDLRRQFGDAVVASMPGPDGKVKPVVIVTELGVRSKEGSSASSRVLALDARDKSPLWSIDLPGISPRLAIAPPGVPASSPSMVVVVADAELLTFDLVTGAPIGLPMKLPDGGGPNGIPYATVRVIDVDSDGFSEVLLSREELNAGVIGLRLVSLSVTGPGTDPTRPNWAVPIPTAEPRHYFVEHRDLNGDGVQEILLSSERLEFDCRILDGRNGNEIWRRRRPSNVFVGRHSVPVVGEDLDGDGWKDVFVASIDNEAESEDPSAGMKDDGHALFVDCFSGQSGRSLWGTKTPVVGKSSAFLHPFTIPPRWWARGLTGGPSLLITTFLEPKFPHSQGCIYVVDAATGRFEEMAADLAAAEPIDTNGDGREELVAVKITDDRSNSHYLTNIAGELRVFQGENPIGWRRFGQWRPLMDIDGDGLSELLPYSHRGGKLPMISGRDGNQIADWGSEDNISEYVPLTEPSLDLDGDGLTEVLAVHDPWYQHVPGSSQPLRSRALGVDLISPKTRRRLWRSPQISGPPWEGIEQIEFRPSRPRWKDLDGDGELEIIVPYNWKMSESRIKSAGSRSQYGLAILEARTGRLKWNEILKEEPGDRNTSWNPSQDWMQSLQFGDLDHDGVLDLLVSFSAMPWPSNWKREMLVQAVSGRDGHLLWPEVHAQLYRHRDDLDKQQQEAFNRNSSLQQFITNKKGVLQSAIANVDGKPGPEVVVLGFLPEPDPERPFLDGQLILQVLDGGTGKVLFENRWPGMIHPHDMAAVQKLLTLRRPDRDVILISKAKYDPQRREPMNNEDWLLEIPQAGDAVTADGVRELVVLETHKAHPDDQVWKVDLNGDATEELIFWRASERYDLAPELVVSRGLNDERWKRAMPKLQGFVAAKIKLLESGKGLLVSTGQMNVVVSSDGQLLSQFATPKGAGIDLDLGSDDWMSRWAIGQVPRVIISEGSQTRSDLILPTDDSGHIKPLVPAEKIVITPQPNPRNLRRLPWMRNSMALHFVTEAIAWAVMIWLLIVAPLQLARWAWPQRTHVLPAICLIAVALAGAYAMFRIAVILYSLVMNEGSTRIAWGMVAVMFAVGLPLACFPSVLIRSMRIGARPTLLMLGLVILIATVGFVTIMIGMDLNTKEAFDAYRLDGWYLAPVAGAVYGMWLLVVLRWLRLSVMAVIGSTLRTAGVRVA